MIEPDVSGLAPEARPLVDAVARVYLRHTGPWLIGLVAHGSAVKGGFIPGCSDIDLQLYLEDEALSGGHLRLDLGLSVQRDLEGIDTAPFRDVQGFALPAGGRQGWSGPIPGAYHLVAGRLPLPEATAGELRARAREALEGLALPAYVADGLLDHGAGRLERSVRHLATWVWPALYHLLVSTREDEPAALWGLAKRDAIALLPEGSPPRLAAENFHAALLAYYPAAASAGEAARALEAGDAFFEAAGRWWLQAGRT